MGECASKPQQEQKEKKVKKCSSLSSSSNSSQSNTKVIQKNKIPQKQLPHVSSCVNVDKIQELYKREDKVTWEEDQQIKNQQESSSQQQQKENVKEISLSDYIDFKIIPRYNQVNISKTKSTSLPVMIQLEQKAPKELSLKRNPIDLVCVIDDSGSMSGQKAKLVRKSLKYLLKLLNTDDRICLISFDNSATLLTPFLKNTPENKAELKKAVAFIQGRGGTNITAGVDYGLWMLKNRNYKNPVSCMFLLSDGVDNYGKDVPARVESLIQQYDIKDQFTINSYGYGNDHDPDVLLSIANQKNGNFYFIQSLEKVTDWFILSLSGLLTVLIENIEIRIKQQNNYNITKCYGHEEVMDNDKIIHIPHLVSDKKKEYILDINIPAHQNLLKDEEKLKTILISQLIGKALEGKNREIDLEAKLNIQFLNEGENIGERELNEQFEVAFMRAKGGDQIGQACQLAEQGKYDDANKIFDNLLEEIEVCPFKEHRGIQFVKNDIIKSKNVCKPKVFEQQGKAFMFKKKKDHISRQASLCSIQDWDNNQKEMYDNYENGDYNLSDDSGSEDNHYSPQHRKNSIQFNHSGNNSLVGSYVSEDSD